MERKWNSPSARIVIPTPRKPQRRLCFGLGQHLIFRWAIWHGLDVTHLNPTGRPPGLAPHGSLKDKLYSRCFHVGSVLACPATNGFRECDGHLWFACVQYLGGDPLDLPRIRWELPPIDVIPFVNFVELAPISLPVSKPQMAQMLPTAGNLCWGGARFLEKQAHEELEIGPIEKLVDHYFAVVDNTDWKP